MKVLISLDRAEPPVGHLRVIHGREIAAGPEHDQRTDFSGWLSLLRALYEVLGSAATGAPDDE